MTVYLGVTFPFTSESCVYICSDELARPELKLYQVAMVFNHLLLVTCICIVVSLTLYFFYLNRFIAYIIGQVIRILYWNQEASSVWVEIGEHINPLVSGNPVKICNRIYPFLPSRWETSSQRCSLPFEQPNSEDCQRPDSMEVLDSKTHLRG